MWPVVVETGLVDDLKEVVVVEVELDPLKAIPAAVTVGVVAVRVDFVAVGAVTALLCKMEDMILY